MATLTYNESINIEREKGNLVCLLKYALIKFDFEINKFFFVVG